MDDDAYLPGHKRKISLLCQKASLSGESGAMEILRNGIDRPIGDDENMVKVPLGSEITYTLSEKSFVKTARIVFDSDLNRDTVKDGIQEVRDCPTLCNRPLNMKPYTFPATMVRSFQLLADGEVIFRGDDNHQRLVKIPVARKIRALTLRPLSTYGEEKARIFSFDFE